MEMECNPTNIRKIVDATSAEEEEVDRTNIGKEVDPASTRKEVDCHPTGTISASKSGNTAGSSAGRLNKQPDGMYHCSRCHFQSLRSFAMIHHFRKTKHGNDLPVASDGTSKVASFS